MTVKFKPNSDDVIQRYKRFWAGQMQDQIIARIQVREKELGRYWVMQNAPDFEKMFDDYIVYWQSQVKLIDDALPVISPE